LLGHSPTGLAESSSQYSYGLFIRIWLLSTLSVENAVTVDYGAVTDSPTGTFTWRFNRLHRRTSSVSLRRWKSRVSKRRADVRFCRTFSPDVLSIAHYASYSFAVAKRVTPTLSVRRTERHFLFRQCLRRDGKDASVHPAGMRPVDARSVTTHCTRSNSSKFNGGRNRGRRVDFPCVNARCRPPVHGIVTRQCGSSNVAHFRHVTGCRSAAGCETYGFSLPRESVPLQVRSRRRESLLRHTRPPPYIPSRWTGTTGPFGPAGSAAPAARIFSSVSAALCRTAGFGSSVAAATTGTAARAACPYFPSA